MKAGGPALLFEHPKGAQHPAARSTSSAPSGACAWRSASSALDDIGAAVGEILELQPPEGLAAKVRGLKTLKSIADSRPKVVKRGACQEIVLQRRRRRPRPAAGADVLAGRRGPVHHAAGRDHARSAQRAAQRRHVPHAGARSALDRDALADPQGRPRRLPLQRGPHGGRRRARARSRLRVLRERAAAEAHRRVHGRRVPARRGGRAGQGRHGRPRGAGRRRDRARGLHREERARPRKGRSATTPATTRPPSSSRSSTSPRSRCARTRSTRRSSSASRRRRTPGSARRPSGSSCPRCG